MMENPADQTRNADLDNDVLTSVPPLKWLYCYLTEGCNLSCRHCWLAPKYDPDGIRYPVLPVDLFEMAVAEAKEMGVRGLKLTGGEPLLHPRFSDILRIAQCNNLELIVETNGVRCTREVAAQIARSPSGLVSVSLDGVDASTHDHIRGKEGSFKLALAAVRNLISVKIPTQIIMTVMAQNLGQIEDMVYLAEKLGAQSVKFNILQPTARGKRLHERGYAIDISRLIKVGYCVDTELSQTTNVRLIFDYPLAFRPLKQIAEHGANCCNIFHILGILPTGHYALCGIGQHIAELVFGKIGEAKLEHIWNSDHTLNALRSGLPSRLSGICSKCLLKEHCLGSCVAQNYYRGKNLWTSNWFCEEAAAVGMFPITRLISEQSFA